MVSDQAGESGESMVQLKSEGDYVEKKESQYCNSSPNALYWRISLIQSSLQLSGWGPAYCKKSNYSKFTDLNVDLIQIILQVDMQNQPLQM